jgi:hypothetical protein
MLEKMKVKRDAPRGADKRLFEVETSASDVYVYGYPLVLSSIASRRMTDGKMNRFLRVFDEELDRTFGTTAYIVSSCAWLDVGDEPIVLSIPAERRYYSIGVFDAWTIPLQELGLRVAGSASHTVVFALRGQLPSISSDCVLLDVPTSLVYIGARVAAYSDDDRAKAKAFQQSLKLRSIGGRAFDERRAGDLDGIASSREEIVKEVEALSGTEFFSIMSELLLSNPAQPIDKAIHRELESLGVKRGSWDHRATPQMRAVAERAARVGKLRIQRYGWDEIQRDEWGFDSVHSGTARDYVRRSALAREWLHVDSPQDYVRLIIDRDSSGERLDGKFNYSLTFDRWTEPPARGPWFVGTRPVSTAIGAIAERNADGTIQLCFSPVLDENVPASNYFPIASGPFSVVLHIFWPLDIILDGGWLPPEIERHAV